MLSVCKSIESASDGRCEALVVGAGPAGAIAARQLALSGLSVIIADGLMPSAPKIGETLPGAAVRLLKRLGLGEVIESGTTSTAMAHAPVGGILVAWNGRTMVASDSLQDPYGHGLRLDRPLFDAAVRQSAESAGAYHWRADVSCLKRCADGWMVWLDDGTTLSARWIVNATGRRARLSRLLGARFRRSAPLVAIYRTGTPEKNTDLNRTVIASGPDGWVYAGRLGNGLWAFGYHTTPKRAAQLLSASEVWNELVAECPGFTTLFGSLKLESALVARNARGTHLHPPLGEDWVACGDAALSFDPIAGQGLFHALYTGMTAAEVVRTMRDGTMPSCYAAEINKIAAVYTARRHALYRQERRWPTRLFWQVRHTEAQLPSLS